MDSDQTDNLIERIWAANPVGSLVHDNGPNAGRILCSVQELKDLADSKAARVDLAEVKKLTDYVKAQGFTEFEFENESMKLSFGRRKDVEA